jgi:hypothetical protein
MEMKVRCAASRASELPPDIRERARLQDDYTFRISIGKTYTVYAVTIFWNILWYCICDDGYVHFPFWTPAGLFQIKDPRISKYWIFAAINDKDITCTLAYPEWARNETAYYDELAENMDPAVGTWNKYKKLIDEESDDDAPPNP